MTSTKKYGLIIPNSKKNIKSRKNIFQQTRPSVFGNDSSSDEDAHKEVNSQIHREAMKKIMQKQTQTEIQKALEQDSTVYEYDSIYDDLKEQNKVKVPENVTKADKQRKPKYIAQLIKTAEKRTKERERREERMIQREREKEGDEFADKPEFVTAAYKKKMLEREGEIEEEKRMDAIEDALDVKKQKDLTGFYRHFLNQQIGDEKPVGDSSSQKTGSTEDKKPTETNEDEDTDLSFSSEDESDDTGSEKQIKKGRAHSSDSSDEEHDRRSKKRRNVTDSGSDSSRQRTKEPTPKRRSAERRQGSREEARSNSRGQASSSRHRHSERYSEHRHRHPRSSRSPRDSHKHRSRRRSRSRSPRRRSLDRQNRSRTPDRRARVSNHETSRGHGGDKKDKRAISPHKSGAEKDLPKQEKNADKKPTEDTTAEPGVVGPQVEKAKNSFARHTDKDTVLSARERYLARKAAVKGKTVAEPDSD